MPTANELEVGRRLVAKATEVNLLMDDYRGAHEEIQRLEVMLLSLRDRLKVRVVSNKRFCCIMCITVF